MDRTNNQPAKCSAEYYIAFEGNAKYGYGVCIDDVSITGTSLNMPVVTTTPVSSPTATTATSGGNVTSGGTSAVTARGVCWSTIANPTTANDKTTDGSGTGVFTSAITGLVPSSLYHVRAYATNTSGTSYGNDVTFTAGDLAAPVASAATAISSTGFTANWNVVDGAVSYRLDVSTSSTFQPISPASDLIISEYVEGSSYNKAIEIFNGTGSYVDLSSYSLKKQTNGAGLFGDVLYLSGVLANNSTFVIVNSSAGTTLTALANLSTNSNCITFNGNDAVALYKSVTQIDVVGIIDQVANWGIDMTLVRKSSISSPTTTFNKSTDWDQYAADDFTHVGSHIYNGNISSFVPNYENLSVPGTSQSVTSLSPNTLYYCRVRAVNGSSTSPNSNTITVTTGKAIQSVATGLWSLTSTWLSGQIPTASDDVTIKAAKPVTVDLTNAVSSNLTIESGSSLTINPGKALTVIGTLTNNALAAGMLIKSDATGTGSLIQNSTGINATAERYVSQWTNAVHGWHHLSSPVAAQAIAPAFTDPVAANYDFYQWDEPTSTWLNLKVTGIPVFVQGTGYLVAYNTSGARQFTGELNVTGATFSGLSKTNGSYQGWHLLGNPFSSAIRWNDGNWAISNITATAKIWKESTASYIDITAGTGIIPAMNGFMVETSGAGSLTIPAASRVHDDIPWHSINTELIRLVAHDPDQNTAQESNIRVNAKATDGFDPDFDSYFLAGLAPEFYSTSDSAQLSTNTLPYINDSRAINMGFVKNASENFSIELAENSISGVSIIYLTDKKTGTLHDLSKTPVYHFTSSEGDDANRFILSFTLVTGTKPGLSSGIRIYTNGKTMFVNQTDAQQGMIRLYNAAGQLLSVKSLMASPTQTVNLSNLSPGVYIITISTDKGLYNQKIVLTD